MGKDGERASERQKPPAIERVNSPNNSTIIIIIENTSFVGVRQKTFVRYDKNLTGD